MKQLGILDSAFINLEQSNTPQHIGGLGIYDPSTAPDGKVRFKQVIANFEQRLSLHPLFRTRLVEVPGGIDRPYWVKDANFDVEFHLRHIALPEPGDWRQLCIQVARLHARPLDMSRPLWEAYIIEGLDNIPNLPPGCFAIYTKMHHALVDGAGGSSFMAVLHDLTPDPSERDLPTDEPKLIDIDPTSTELLARAAINRVRNTVGLARGTLRTGRDLGKYALGIMREDIPSPDVSAPKSLFNTAVGPHRVFDAAELPLAGFKTIKNQAGVTVNDVALCIVGGAMARYLEHRGAPISGSLAATMPVNMRTRRESSEDNNQVGSVFASLHSDEKDPLARLRLIHDSTEEAKQHGEASPMVDVLKTVGVFSPAVVRPAAKFWAKNQLSQYIPVNISTVISNVAGPNFPLYSAGAKLVDYYGLGVLTPGMGIFHLVFSYDGKVTLSVLGDRAIMPDPEVYHDCLIAAYEELYAAAVSGVRDPAPVTAPTRPTKRKAAAKVPGRKAATKRKTGTAVKKTTKARSKAAKPKARAKAAAKRRPAKASAAPKRKVAARPKARPKATSR